MVRIPPPPPPKASRPDPLPEGFKANMSAHSPESTKADIERAKVQAKDDWETDFLHDISHDLTNNNSISKTQRQRLQKILTRPVKGPTTSMDVPGVDAHRMSPEACPEQLFGHSRCDWMGPEGEIVEHYRQHHPEIISRYQT